MRFFRNCTGFIIKKLLKFVTIYNYSEDNDFVGNSGILRKFKKKPFWKNLPLKFRSPNKATAWLRHYF
jgi:hypothetical protein